MHQSGLLGRHLGIWGGLHHYIGATGASAGPAHRGRPEAENKEVPVVPGGDLVSWTCGIGKGDWSRRRRAEG